jgi:hypothetical protein
MNLLKLFVNQQVGERFFRRSSFCDEAIQKGAIAWSLQKTQVRNDEIGWNGSRGLNMSFENN